MSNDYAVAFPGCEVSLCYYLAQTVETYIKAKLKDDKRIAKIMLDCVLGLNLSIYDSKDVIVVDELMPYTCTVSKVQLKCCLMPDTLLMRIQKALYRKRGTYLLTIVYQNRDFVGHKAFAALLTRWR